MAGGTYRGADGEWTIVGAGVLLAVIGWVAHGRLLALAGCLIALTAYVLWVWQRNCLTGVSYRRTLSAERVTFGERLELRIEIVNDKILPLTWLHVSDVAPDGLLIDGRRLKGDFFRRNPRLQQLLPMFPYQRTRRRLTIVADRRGQHVFGPFELRSGNPLGYREARRTVEDVVRLLVFPKVFALNRPAVASRVPLGDVRSRRELLGDPSRPIGVRGYRAGDPLRHIDWRATARTGDLLVRVFEPTTSLRLAVVTDPRLGLRAKPEFIDDLAEFTIAVTASVLAELSSSGVSTGLYSTATIGHRVVAQPPGGSGPESLPALLELLARCDPRVGSTAGLLTSEVARLQHGASVLVIAPDFDETTLAAIADLRRRLPVTTLWVANPVGRPPADGVADARWEVTYADDWARQDTLDLAE